MQHEVTRKQDLLCKDGTIAEEGWAREPLWKYDRKRIRSNRLRIKEWDYYLITDPEKEFSFAATFSDLGFAGLFVIAFIDYRRKATSQTSAIKLFTLHRTGLASSPEDDNGVTFFNKDMLLSFVTKNRRRHLIISAPKLRLPNGKEGFKAEITLEAEGIESMNIATGWKENRRHFYYNEKLCSMRASGRMFMGFEKMDLSATSYALLDWGRGRWARKSTWYWSSLSGWDGDKLWSMNLGYGFSDRSSASENAIIYDGIIHKLDQVAFDMPEDYTSRPWIIKDNEGRLEMRMETAVNRSEKTDLKLIVSDQNQVFGVFSGSFTLDDGRRIAFDNAYGFAERVMNKW